VLYNNACIIIIVISGKAKLKLSDLFLSQQLVCNVYKQEEQQAEN